MNSTRPSSVDSGKDVHMLPICCAHNTGAQSGADYYIKLDRSIRAIILDNYQSTKQIEVALATRA